MTLAAQQASENERKEGDWFPGVSDPPEAGPIRRERWPALLCLDVVAAVVVALLSLRGLRTADLGGYGLPPALPFAWYAALTVLVLGAVLVLSLRTFMSWLAGLFLVGFILVVNGTGAILADAPRFAWSYKHVGVTNYITQFGQVEASIDIYHRWPGFFSLASTYGAVAGLSDAASYAKWAGLFFVLLEALLVVAIARLLLNSPRAGWAAGLVFVAINFVGQDYFAPQPFAFVLALGVLWITLAHFMSEPHGRLARGGRRLLAFGTRSGGPAELAPQVEPIWGRRTATAVVMLLFVAIVPSHQLTPYIVVATLALIAVVGGLRPRWLVLVFAALALFYLVPNFSYLQNTYRVFSGFDPFGNAESVNALTYVQQGKVLNVRAGEVLTAFFGLLALVALVVSWRRKRAGVVYAALALIAPAFILVTLRYGGEGSLRVILFAAPWAAVLIGSLVVERRLERNLLLAPVLIVCLGLFLPAYYGVEQVNQIPKSELTASEFLYANAVPQSVIVQSAPNFPTRVGARYPELRGERNTADPVLTRRAEFRQAGLGPANVAGVVTLIQRYSADGYVVFSQSQEAYAETFGVSSVTDLRSLESAMVTSGKFSVFYQNDTTRIYQLLG